MNYQGGERAEYPTMTVGDGSGQTEEGGWFKLSDEPPPPLGNDNFNGDADEGGDVVDPGDPRDMLPPIISNNFIPAQEGEEGAFYMQTTSSGGGGTLEIINDPPYASPILNDTYIGKNSYTPPDEVKDSGAFSVGKAYEVLARVPYQKGAESNGWMGNGYLGLKSYQVSSLLRDWTEQYPFTYTDRDGQEHYGSIPLARNTAHLAAGQLRLQCNRARSAEEEPLRASFLLLRETRSLISSETPQCECIATIELRIVTGTTSTQHSVTSGALPAEDASLENGVLTLRSPTPIEGKSVLYNLLPIEVKWEAKPEFANVDDNPDPWTNKTLGKRIFPDNTEDNPGSDMRREVNVKVRIPGYANKTVYLKAFDPDDPSQISDPSKALDPNEDKGDDNIKGAGLIAEWGIFLPQLTRKIEITTDSEGEATAVFKVNQQPGNNYRIAVAIKDTDLNVLQVTNPSGQGFVTPDDKSVSGFNGAITPMLTVWRKLHIEVDSMQALIPPKASPDRTTATGDNWGTNGPFNVLHLASSLPGGENFYEDGKIKSGGIEFQILQNDATSITHKSANPSQSEKNAFLGSFEVFDDDDSGTGHPLPYANLITQGVKDKYKYAYIDIVPRTTNPTPDIPFELYSATLIYNPFGDNITVPSSGSNNGFDSHADDQVGFWNHYIVAQYQGTKDESADPLGGDYGVVPGQTFWGGIVNPEFSTVYLEVVREVAAATGASYSGFLDKVVAHEIGHVPAHLPGHPEDELMGDGAPGSNFSAESLRRFRKTAKWEGSW